MPHLELSAVARLAGINITRTIYDGQQIRVFTCLLRLADQKGFILPDTQGDLGAPGEAPKRPAAAREDEERPEEEGEDEDEREEGGGEREPEGARETAGRHVGYQGARVLDPTSGFHVNPVVVFDFASLYPSIIQAHNLCFSTLSLRADAVAHLEAGKDYLEIEVGGDGCSSSRLTCERASSASSCGTGSPCESRSARGFPRAAPRRPCSWTSSRPPSRSCVTRFTGSRECSTDSCRACTLPRR